jgi:membrane protease YdiL (CAAX protease family)
MTFTQLFVNRHAELRSGWRALLFVVLLIVFSAGAIIPFALMGILNLWVQTLAAIPAALLATYLMTRFINRKPFGAVGLQLHPAMFKEFGLGCLVGFLMMTGVFVVEYASGFASWNARTFSFGSAVWLVLSSIVFFGFAAFLEEVMFRGYLFQTLIQAVSLLPALIIMAILFALAHGANPNVSTLGFVNIGLAGIWLSFAYVKTKGLWLPWGLHLSWNFSQTTLYSFPTSGSSFEQFRFFDVVQSGPEWLTGGAFGPEGGVLATVALVCGIWYVLKSKHVREPEGVVTLDSIEDLTPPKAGEQST